MRQLIALLCLSGLSCGLAAGKDVPLPPPRPILSPLPAVAELAETNMNADAISSRPSECDQRLAALADVVLLPRLIGPGACGGDDMVELRAVRLADHSRIDVKPAAVLRCAMAATFAGWLRDEVAPRVAKLGSALREIDNFDSYECRSRNRVAGAKISEHAKGNAIDVSAFQLADGRRIEPTDMMADKDLRVALRASACERFTTVLGLSSDGFHEAHIHLDIAARHHGFRICQWAIGEPARPTALAATEAATKNVRVRLPTPRPAIPSVKHARKL